MKKHVKKILIGVGAIFACLVLAVCVYLIYLAASYSRIDDNLPLTINNNPQKNIELGKEYSIATFNVGFGAYSPEFSFFMDKSTMKSGKKYKGKYGKAISLEQVRRNIDGIAGVLEANNYDFILLQEVDEDGDRSYHFNQRKLFENRLNNKFGLMGEQEEEGYASIYAKNFHSAYLYYPFNDPHGRNTSGLLTLSKYNVDSASRRSLPISGGFDKFFDLDRCFSVSRLKAGDKELVIVNLHLSAYDKGGVIREKQIKMLFDFISAERDKGNYVIAGGDFNHDICGSDGTFPTDELRPDWVSTLPALPTGFGVVEANNKDKVPTCRSSARAYRKGSNYTVITDGFIISDNITVKEKLNEDKKLVLDAFNLDMGFEFSDHNAVQMTFILEEL